MATDRAAALLAAALLAGSCGPTPDADLILRHAVLVDGSGAPPRRADVAVRGDRVLAVGELTDLRAVREIDAAGQVIAPGFVDLHSHADLILLGDRTTQERLLAAKISQGVTTVIVGNCGLGAAPANSDAATILAAINGWMTPSGVDPGPMSVADYLDALEAQGIALNAGTLIPHGPVRVSAMGLAAGAPSVAALDAMRQSVEIGIRDGAFGLSAGLIYPPGMYSDTEELAALATVVARAALPFTAHVRGSSETLLRATEELIEIGRKSGARIHHSHLEAVGEESWAGIRRVLQLEDAARAEGVRISHDVFPYTRAATMMSAIFPPWALEGGMDALLGRLADDSARRRIARDLATHTPQWPPWQPGGWPHNLVRAVGWDGIAVASVGGGEPYAGVGRSLDALAREQRRDPFDVVADLMLAHQGQVGQLVGEISGDADRLDGLLEILVHPAAAVISDAEDYGRGTPHPAHAGAFVKTLRLSRERSLMPLHEAVRRMTSYPASIVGLEDRGIVRPGSYADLVIFDPRTVGDRATWEAPRRTASGVRWVVLNGRVVVEDGAYRGGRHGRVLRSRSTRRGEKDSRRSVP